MKRNGDTQAIDWADESKWFSMPKQKRSRATMQAVFKSAVQLFAENGYDSTTPADIAKAAGVTTGSIYRRFPDKEAILYTVIESFGESRVPEVTRLCEPAAWKNKTPEDILTFYVEMMFSAYKHGEEIIRITERRRLVDPVVSRILSEWKEHIVTSFSELLKQNSKLSLNEIRRQFRVLHTIIRAALVYRILADPNTRDGDAKVRDSDLKACFIAIALNHMRNL